MILHSTVNKVAASKRMKADLVYMEQNFQTFSWKSLGRFCFANWKI